MSLRRVSSEAPGGSAAFPVDPNDDTRAEVQNDPDFERDARELWDKGMARLNKPRVLSEPEQVCNLPKDQCPTPPHIFFISNRPSIDYLYPSHYHQLDKDCPLGAEHEIHCVFKSSNKPQCIIPCTIKHQCCSTDVWPRNKSVSKPGILIPVPIDDQHNIIVRGGSGVSYTRPANNGYSDLPVIVKPMSFDANWSNDESGRRAYGVNERSDIVDGEWIYAKESLDGTVGDLKPSEPGVGMDPDKSDEEKYEADVFGDRHFVDE